MGTGALFSSKLLPDSVLSNYGELSGPATVFVRFRDRANPASARRSLQRITDTTNQMFAANPYYSTFGTVVALLPVQHPAEIVNYRSMGNTPAILAGLAAGAIVALGLTLAASVRRRRRDLALLKTLGFTRRQLSATVAWQASVAVVIGVALGVPFGIAIGRWLWILFARDIYAVPHPTVPALSVVLVALGALVVANVVAALPGRSAARTPAALILRAE
jgi:ABC-type antimicrobial peptide transport system permease subunit